MSVSAPRSGACSPWVDGEQVSNLPAITRAVQSAEKNGLDLDVDLICANAAAAASDVLYELSGRVFTGGDCGPVTVRPLSRPTDIDSRTAWYGGLGFNTSWGFAQWYDSVPGACTHYGSINPPEVELGDYPVTSILLVKIDGTVIPTDEYELRDHRVLVRMRPNAGFTPTERWGWPTGQIQDLPDTELGTFSVTYLYGQPAPPAGQLAAVKLAEFLALPQLGDDTHYPSRVTAITRQGVTTQVASVIDLLKGGSLGIYEVDLFLDTVNPKRNQRQAMVWSPDVGRPRRQANPTIS